ncbi:MAG: Crp/Fnr family transcriptional regulator [Bacteroidota bacterium]
MQDQSNLWFFEGVDLYNVLCPHKVKRMADDHEFSNYKKGDYIYFPDEPANHIYLISDGRIKVGSFNNDGKEMVKAILSKGEIFGEMGLAGEEKRGDFAQAMDDNVRICQLNIEDMKELMRDNQPLSLNMIKLIGWRLRKVERRIEGLVHKDAKTRVIEFLTELADEKGQKVGFETMIKNHFTHKDIASLTGTSRQTVTTILNELREKNVITFDRRRILIRDVEKLSEEAA